MNIPAASRVGAAILFLWVAGCGPSRISLKPTFWQETQQTIGVATVVAPKMSASRVGAQGLLDIAINSAMAGSLEAHLESLDASRFNVVADHYVAKLKESGFEVRRLSQDVDPVQMPPFEGQGSGEFAAVDLRPLGKQEGVDKLILLSITQCGTVRSYYGFIPLGAPQALCVSKGEMIDVQTNQVEWRAFPEQAKATVSIEGDWDQPPDFTNLTAAIEQAMNQAQVFVFEEFFGPGTAPRFETAPAFSVAADKPGA